MKLSNIHSLFKQFTLKNRYSKKNDISATSYNRIKKTRNYIKIISQRL